MKYSLLLLLSITLLQQKKGDYATKKDLIKGKWSNIDLGHCKYDDYRDLEFTDNTVVLYARISSIYYEKYFIDGDTLTLIDSTTNDTSFSRILTLSRDTLVLSSVRDQHFEHAFNREE